MLWNGEKVSCSYKAVLIRNSYTGFWVLYYLPVSTYYLMNIDWAVTIGESPKHRLWSSLKNELFTMTLKSLCSKSGGNRVSCELELMSAGDRRPLASYLLRCLRVVRRVPEFWATVHAGLGSDGATAFWVIRASFTKPISSLRWTLWGTVGLVCCQFPIWRSRNVFTSPWSRVSDAGLSIVSFACLSALLSAHYQGRGYTGGAM